MDYWTATRAKVLLDGLWAQVTHAEDKGDVDAEDIASMYVFIAESAFKARGFKMIAPHDANAFGCETYDVWRPGSYRGLDARKA